jgi:thiamine pyrophosphate-dependent acetolactate synthase large subunit-like protein
MSITDAHAENCGALGICVSERAGLDAAIGRAVAHPGLALIEVMTDPDLV